MREKWIGFSDLIIIHTGETENFWKHKYGKLKRLENSNGGSDILF